MAEENKDIITQCGEFLRRSSRRYNATLSRAAKDMRRFSNEFWDDDMKNTYRKGSKRIHLSLNNWNVICNAMSSPFSASPWHVELKNKEGEFKDIQDSIDAIEAKNDVKMAELDAFRKEILTGYGFIVVSTEEDEFTGEPTVVLESVKHLQSVAMDPSCLAVDGSDAEEGAIVNFISVKKAKRLYGDQVVPFGYPDSAPLMNLSGMEQWGCPEDQLAIVSYYVKEEGGVRFYKICGNLVVQDVLLPIKYIPIIRFAGNEVYEKNDINYNGIIQQTMHLELGANIAYSTLIERCGRSVKASYLINVDAADGLKEYIQKASDDDLAAILWKGEHEPKPLVEQFATGDLQDVITTTRTLMEDVVGVPLTGIPQGTPEKTATEILRQQVSKEANTASYYNNAFSACNTISKILIELLNNGEDLRFSLENGPSVVTRQMKARQELTALSAVTPDTLKPVIAKFFADTLEDDVGKDLSRNIVANMPRDLVFLTDDTMDPAAVHQLEQMKATLDECMAQLDEQIAANAELQKQLDTAEINLMENREQRIMDWEKFKIQETNKVNLEMMKLNQDGVESDNKLAVEQQKLQNQAEAEQAKAINETNRTLLEAQKFQAEQFDQKKQAYAQGEDSGYAQGVNDGVDAALGR